MLNNTIQPFDQRRNLFIGKDLKESLSFAVEHWIHSAKQAILQRGRFVVALSGGSTPKAIYQALTKETNIDWTKVWLFWSDERAVAPDHTNSNYKMAMEHFQQLPIPPHQIFRMKAETEIEKHAKEYEETIIHYLGTHLFDLVMLGVGEDGHTASLFPNTLALSEETRLVVANYVPQLNTHRMTLTFPCINKSARIAIYALGTAKQEIIPQILQAAMISPYPTSHIGTPEHQALWILDGDSSHKLEKLY